MSDQTHIEWTDTTWNILSGCTRVSAGCDHCYIERTPPFRMAHRKFDGDGPGSTTGVRLYPGRLAQPLHWRKPRKVFVNSLADLFHDEVADAYIAEVFAIMALAPRHTFQILTKRPARMRALLRSDEFWVDVMNTRTTLGMDNKLSTMEPMPWPLPNVWLGVSVESQQWADIRIPALLDTPAAVRFLSCEPLLGPVNLFTPYDRYPIHGGLVDWVIVGGESGPGARPMHPGWARTLRDQCVAAGVPFLFKQWGEWAPTGYLGLGTTGDPREICVPTALNPKARDYEGEWIRRVGKKIAGRELDGRTWDEYPAAAR